MCFRTACTPAWLHLLSWLALSLVSPHAFAANHSCPIAVSSGQPACAESNDVGSNSPNPTRSQHVGNPVDVVSGNKYQSELDVRLGGSQLSLVRHYNSVNAATNLGLGNGWQHTYSVQLISDGEDIRRIVQSDGRLVEFRQNGSLYQSLNEDDGYVLRQSDSKHTWHLPDGRVLSFHGSFLTEISIGDGGVLSLFYRRMRLHSVTDELGRSIVFRYQPGSMSLPAYEPTADQIPPGHLTAVELPDGSEIQYRYDHRQNLVSVDYPTVLKRKEGYIYRYNDELNSSLLTERANSYGKVLGRWGYDDAERVTSYRNGLHIRADGSEAGEPDLSLSYAAGEIEVSGTTVVTVRDGARTDYQWVLDDKRRVTKLTERYAEPSQSQSQAAQIRQPQMTQNEELQTSAYAEDVLTILELDDLGYPKRINFQSVGESEPDELAVRYSQVGRILDVNWKSGFIRSINNKRQITGEEYRKFVNSHWEAGTRTPDVLSAAAQRGFVETSARRFLADSSKALEVGTSIGRADLHDAWSSGTNGSALQRPGLRSKDTENSSSTECANPLIDCEALLQARDYAEVSDCAYLSSHCSTRYVEADLDQLGVVWPDLVSGSFRTIIFYDRENDEYIVSFAGTDFTSVGDWVNNAQQEFGSQSSQYEQAVRLARQLVQANPDSTFSFTGHSLGGGLATAAAAATDQEAIVFNPAALSQETANNYNFDYTIAENNTEVFSVEGELLSEVQSELDFTNEVQGNVHMLQRPRFSWIQANVGQNPLWAYNTRLSVTLHGMAAVRQSLSESVERYNCE